MKQDTTNKTYFAYIRKSSEGEDAQMLSIEAQKRELAEFCKRRGIKVKEFFIESASAYKKGRVEFNRMLEKFEKKEADGLLVYHLTRIARNAYDGGRVIYMMDEGKIQNILTPSGEFSCTNSDDLLVMQIHFAMAKKSSDDTSTFVKRDIKSKLLKGEYPTWAPTGYLNMDDQGRMAGKTYDPDKQQLLQDIAQRDKRTLRRVEVDPIVGPYILRLFQLAATGLYTLEGLCDEAHELGMRGIRTGSRMHKSSVKRILTNPMYYGAIRWKGEVIEPEDLPKETRHFPIITKDLFDTVQEVLGFRAKPRRTIHKHTWRGLIQCGECGGAITSELQKGMVYYRCTKKKNKKKVKCSQKYLREDDLEKQIHKQLKEYVLPKDFADWAIAVLRDNSKEETLIRDKKLKKLRSQATTLDNKLSQLLDMKLSVNNSEGEMLSDDEYIERKNLIVNERREVNKQIEGLENDSEDWLEQCEQFFDFTMNIERKWNMGDSDAKRLIFVTVFGSNSTLKDKELLTVAKKPFFRKTSLTRQEYWRE